jgi:hypothetical protein
MKTKRFLPIVLATIVVLALASCGGGAGDASTPEEDVKAVSADFLEAVIDERNGEACALTTEPGRCLGALVLAQGFAGEGGMEALLGEDWRERLDAAQVTFADEDHATIAPFTKDKDPQDLVREDGDWLIVYKD